MDIQTAPINDLSQVRYAGFGRRFLAYLIDSGIVLILGLAILSMFGKNPYPDLFKAETTKEFERIATAEQESPVNTISFCLSLIYFVGMWVHSNGATIGKKLLGIKIVRDDLSNIGYARAIVRYFGLIISGIILGIGHLWILWDKRKQGLQDKLAGTVVVETGTTPNYLVAIVLALIFSGIYFAVLFGVLGRAFMLGFNEALQEDKQTVTSVDSSYENITDNDEVKRLYAHSEELFLNIRSTTDPAEVVKLNDENIKELKAAIQLEPGNAKLWYSLGNAYTWISSEGTLEDMFNAYKKSESLEPTNGVYINGVGDALIRMGKYEEAILQFQKTFRLTDKSGFANLSAGTAYKQLGIYDKAAEHFRKAIEIFEDENESGIYDDEILSARKELAEITNR